MTAIPGSVPVTGFIAPTDSTDTYPSHDALWGRGGHRTVATITQRNAITADRRAQGMLVYVAENDITYALRPSPWDGTDADWTFSAAGSSIPVISFAFGDATGVIWTPSRGGWLDRIRVGITQAFDQPATLSVGTVDDPEAAMPVALNDPNQPYEYETTPDIHLNAGQSLYLSLTPGGSTQGAGFILLSFNPD